MKKLLYFTILTFMLIPFAARAEGLNLEEIHNSISEDNSLAVKSIPLESYKETNYFKTCMANPFYQIFDNPEEMCLEQIYGEIVVSKIKKTVEIPDGIVVAHQNCDIEQNTCEILVRVSGFNHENQIVETYKINFEEVENPNKFSEIKSNYKMYDLGYINQVLNYGTSTNYLSETQQSSKILKIYPELKQELEKDQQIQYFAGTTSGAGGEFKHGATIRLVAYHNDAAIDVVSVSHTTHRILFIPDTTQKSKEAYIEVAEKRIREYINDDNYEIKIEFNEIVNYEYCELYPESCLVQDVFEEGDEYSFEVYKLYINDVEYELLLMPVPEKEIKKIFVTSKNYNSDISIETQSADVPLDTSVEAEDVTIKYKGFLKAYDIDLYSGIKDEYITQVKDGIIVRIPLLDDYDKKKLDIYHIAEDGKKGEKYQATVEEIDGKKYAVFTTNHFSIYAIEEEIEEIENPNTYDEFYKYIGLLIVSLIGLLSINIFSRKKNI